MNVLLLVLVFGGCYYVGNALSKNYYKRKGFFEDALLFCNCLKGEVSFSKNSISQIALTYQDSFKKEFKILIKNYLKALEKKSYCEVEDLKKFVDKGLLEEIEYNFVLQFLSVLGKSGVQEQVQSISSFELKFKEFYETASKKIKEGNLIKKVSIMLGLALCIIFA